MRKYDVSISVIMGVYNQNDEKVLREGGDSILNQTFKDFEFIIYDDASQPDGALILEKIN